MRCLNVIHELSAPTGTVPQTLLTDHLQQCPSCAQWAERNAQLDRVWDATRAPELSTAAWDRMWANVAESWDQTQLTTASTSAPVPVLAMPPASHDVRSWSWRRSAVVAFALAQAAVLLVGVRLTWFQGPVRQQPRLMPIAQAPVVASPHDSTASDLEIPDFDLSTDQLAMISLDDKTVRDLPTSESESPNAVDLPMFNAMESLASLQ